MAWILLLAAGACEMVWPIGFKLSNGFRQNSWAIAGTMAIMLLSFWLMAQAIHRGIHVGTAYAVWTGIGATGTAILGMLLFNEPRDLVRLGCLTLVIGGVIGLKFASPPRSVATSTAETSTVERPSQPPAS
jgi:quaternary ammonium compound-resistance protein SugE